MPEKAGWRMRNKNRPKDLKVNVDDTDINDDASNRSSTWKKKSRPSTPSSAVTDDSQSAARPKTSRYLSGFPHLKDNLDAEFSKDWWNDIQPPPAQPPTDPQEAVRSISSFMHELPSKPISVSHYSNLFRIFEDYRKVREQNDSLKQELRETTQAHEAAVTRWAVIESQYQAEIRRLELLIAHGTSGMTGLVQARKDSIVRRKRVNINKSAIDEVIASSAKMPLAELDREIGARSKEVLLQRPSSPSSRMIALSRQLATTDLANDVPIGTPPAHTPNLTLSRKLKSELDFSKMTDIAAEGSVSPSVDSEFAIAGDPLPDEIEAASSFSIMDSSIRHDALMALQELGGLVARKNGIDSRTFMNGLVQLLEPDQPTPVYTGDPAKLLDNTVYETMDETMESDSHKVLTHSRSQPLLGSEETYRLGRHFSFEPGDDTSYPIMRMPSSSNSSRQVEAFGSARSMRNSNSQKPSKIPSPINHPELSNVRREGSLSSVNSNGSKANYDELRDSRSSVLTAFRRSTNNSGNLATPSSARALRSPSKLPEKEDPHYD